MRLKLAHTFACVALMGSLALALASTDVVYVTDLAIYTLLAPCAQSAISYDVMSMTYENCPEAVTDLQSCVCSKNNYFASLSAAISTDVSENCGSTASSDQSSAATVFSAYCNQNAVVSFPTPTIQVTQYITDIPEMSYLAPCASSQVSYAVMSMTYELCPADAPDLATCVCAKNQNSLMVSQSINRDVSEACSSQTADIASAQAFFSAYCNLNEGTSSFPSATNPPGDMSYYITDMPQYGSLVGCAKSALSSAVFANTYDLCPNGPQLLASCACIKESMSSIVSSYITSNIKWDCTAGDTEDISSALNIFALYCSAARNEAVVTGITTSVSQTAPFGLGGGGAINTGQATATGTMTSSGDSSGSEGPSNGNNGASSGSSSSDSSSQPNIAMIAGIAIGGVVLLAAVGVAAFFVFRHVRKNKRNRPAANNFQQLQNLPPAHGTNNASISASHAGIPGTPTTGNEFKPELSGTPIGAGAVVAGAGAGAGSMLIADNAPSFYGTKLPQPPPSPSISPVSAHHRQQYSYPNHTELPGQMYATNNGYLQPTAPEYSELQGQQTYPQQTPPLHVQAELYGGHGQQPYGRPPQGQPIYQADSTPIQSPNQTAASRDGMTFQSGPIPQSYSELDGDSHPRAI